MNNLTRIDMKKYYLTTLLAIFVSICANAYTEDDFVMDFQWLEPNNKVTIAVGETHQLKYSTSTNYSKVFLTSMANCWVHIDFAGMQHVVESPEGYSINENGVIRGLKVGSYAIHPTSLIKAASGVDKWLYITVVSEREETEPNNTMETANEIQSKIRCGLYNTTDIDYFRYDHNLNNGEYVTFKIHYNGPREAPFGYRWATFSGGMNVEGGSLVTQDQNCRALVTSRDDVYLEIYYDQSLTQYFDTGESFLVEIYIDGEPVLSSKTLSISAVGNGIVTFGGKEIRETTEETTLAYGSSATMTFTPDKGYKLSSLTSNGSNVYSSVSNNQYTINSITRSTSIVATFEEIPPTYYSLSIQSGEGGSVMFNETTITNTTKSFSVLEGSSATITMTPNKYYRLDKITNDGVDVTSKASNNTYTISSINGNTSLVISFAEDLQSFSQEGINYQIKSVNNKTLNVNSGNYSGCLTIPESVNYDGGTWMVGGVLNDAFNSSSITSIIWNPKYALESGGLGNQTNPNLLLYVKSMSYAPSNVQNVIVNGNAKKIVLVDAVSGNDFDCPIAFTAEEISYTHKYGMTTGLHECRGWETIVLPFTVRRITHETKGTLVPFKVYNGENLPFWLYEFSESGFIEANSVEANTPYIISFPNNSYYYTDYNLSGNITFSGKNVTVASSDELKSVSGKNKMFVANYSTLAPSAQKYPLNVQNDYSNHNDYYLEGSTFIPELRTVHPFEAYMTTTSTNAKSTISIFEDMTTAICEIPLREDAFNVVKIYNLQGQLVKSRCTTIEEALNGLAQGVYVIKGKKYFVKMKR